jgi:hydrogenase maturation factor
MNVVEYLLAQDVEIVADLLGLTPLDYAKSGKNLAVISKLEAKFPGLNGNSD